jgi:hypothetical protein
MPTTTRSSTTLLTAGAVLILAVGAIHAIEAPDHLEEQTYIGVLFVLNAIGALVAAIGIARDRRSGWLLGMLVAAGAFVAFVLSRTTGLPSYHEAEWEPLGLVSLIFEAAYVLVAARALAAPATTARTRREQRREPLATQF